MKAGTPSTGYPLFACLEPETSGNTKRRENNTMKSKDLNKDIKKAIKDKKICFYEVAFEVGINPCTLSHWLQREVDGEKRARIFAAIDRVKV